MLCFLAVHDDRVNDLRSPERMVTTPKVATTTYRDSFGNVGRRLVAPAGDFSLRGDGTIEDNGLPDVIDPSATEVPVASLPSNCLVYLLGSRYCETDRLSQIAWDMFGHVSPGWDRVQAICDFVNGHIVFDYLNASATRTAFEAYQGGTGVCRDYAHLAIALCRCMNIPARYVNGYLGDIGVPILDPMDFSAWVEVYLGGRWVTFDPRSSINSKISTGGWTGRGHTRRHRLLGNKLYVLCLWAIPFRASPFTKLLFGG
jgi:transglutaminase-like putative cysteine protease